VSRKQLETLMRFLLGAIVTVIYLIPLYWMVTTSLKPVDQIFQKPPVLFPSPIQIDSYKQIFGLATGRAEIYIDAFLYLKNSLIIASATMVLTLIMAVPAAYAISRFQFRGRSVFVLFLLVAQMLPSVLMVIPLFVLFRQWGIINLSYTSVILADTALALPFAIIVLRTSFLQIPTEARGYRCCITSSCRLSAQGWWPWLSSPFWWHGASLSSRCPSSSKWNYNPFRLEYSSLLACISLTSIR